MLNAEATAADSKTECSAWRLRRQDTASPSSPCSMLGLLSKQFSSFSCTKANKMLVSTSVCLQPGSRHCTTCLMFISLEV